jgi:glycosyltransferase involved in cell wall biosynthesis
LTTEVDEARSDAVHVAIVVNSYPPRLGGLESHVYQLANELKTAGARVTVVTLSGEPSDTDESGVRVIRLRGYLSIASVISFPGFGTTRRLGRMLTAAGVDVVSTHTRFFPMSFVGVRAARRMGVPAIHTEHGAGFVKSPSLVIQAGSWLVDVTVGRWLLRRSDRVLAVSDEVARFVTRLSGLDARVFHNALQLEKWPPHASAPAPTGIAFLGRLVGGKGWEAFVDAAADLIKRRGLPSLAVHVMGDGPDRAALEARVHARGIADSVTLHGHADISVIRSVLRESVLVNPSRLAEGFQVTLLEAAAAGAQIVSYTVPSVAPLRGDGAPVREVTGSSLEALADAVEDAVRHPRPPMDREVLEAKWSWNARADEYLRTVGTLVGGDRASAGVAGQ